MMKAQGLVQEEMEFIKQGSLTAEEFNALVSVLKLAGVGQNRTVDRRGGVNARNPSMDKSVISLEGMAVKIFGLKEPKLEDSKSEISWENIAGYNQQKRHRWTGRYEAHLWDNSCKNEGQNRKGRQGV